MAPELSSNWKKLQAQIKAEPSAPSGTAKRKAPETATPASNSKRQKVAERPQNNSQSAKKGDPPSAKTQKEARRPGPAQKSMGVTQSSAVVKGTAQTVTPSLSLWAAENDISPESLAEAYNLGSKNAAGFLRGPAPPSNSSRPGNKNSVSTLATPDQESEDRRRANEGLATSSSPVGKYLALDCEMVGVGPNGHDSALARVTVVDFHGVQVYDSLVRPRERVIDWRTHITGLTPRSMVAARDFDDVQRAVSDLLTGGGSRGRILVGHDLRHDLAALELSHPSSQVRDTARFSGFRKYGHGPKPALRVLAREVLGVEIQGGKHSSLEDARAAMLLFRRKKPEFDVECANKFGRVLGPSVAEGGGDSDEGEGKGTKAKSKGKKKKKKKH